MPKRKMTEGKGDELKSRGVNGMVIVTGATMGIGRATAMHVAENHPKYAVILAIRPTADDAERAEKIAKELREETESENVFGEFVELSSWKSVQEFRQRVGEYGLPLVALCNVAGECPQKRSVRDGIEVQFGTNVLGYHFMIKAFESMLKDAAGSHKNFGRVVNVASDWAGDLRIDDVQFESRRYDNDTAYRQSKQCDRMLTITWAERLKDAGVLVNSCHPGDPCTTLSCALGYNTDASRDCSICYTPYYLAVSKDLKASGKYFDQDHQLRRCQFASDSYAEQRQELFDLCETFCK